MEWMAGLATVLAFGVVIGSILMNVVLINRVKELLKALEWEENKSKALEEQIKRGRWNLRTTR